MKDMLHYPPDYKFNQKHLLGIKYLTEFDIYAILDHTKYVSEKTFSYKPLIGKTQINLFFENSTRTQSSFELAGKKLGADILNMSLETSSIKKGETLLDTAVTLNAMEPDILVVRHSASGSCDLLSQKLNCSVINAGDGIHEHPTQALLDAYTIREVFGSIARKIIVICGDIKHSRVARSNILLLNALGARVKLVAPPTLIPKFIEKMGCEIFYNLEDALDGADIVMALRLQKERMGENNISSLAEYYNDYGIKKDLINKYCPDAYIMHPGPVNRNIEIESYLVDDPKSLIQEQVKNGVLIRSAILDMLCNKESLQ